MSWTYIAPPKCSPSAQLHEAKWRVLKQQRRTLHLRDYHCCQCTIQTTCIISTVEVALSSETQKDVGCCIDNTTITVCWVITKVGGSIEGSTAVYYSLLRKCILCYTNSSHRHVTLILLSLFNPLCHTHMQQKLVVQFSSLAILYLLQE